MDTDKLILAHSMIYPGTVYIQISMIEDYKTLANLIKGKGFHDIIINGDWIIADK